MQRNKEYLEKLREVKWETQRRKSSASSTQTFSGSLSGSVYRSNDTITDECAFDEFEDPMNQSFEDRQIKRRDSNRAYVRFCETGSAKSSGRHSWSGNSIIKRSPPILGSDRHSWAGAPSSFLDYLENQEFLFSKTDNKIINEEVPKPLSNVTFSSENQEPVKVLDNKKVELSIEEEKLENKNEKYEDNGTPVATAGNSDITIDNQKHSNEHRHVSGVPSDADTSKLQERHKSITPNISNVENHDNSNQINSNRPIRKLGLIKNAPRTSNEVTNHKKMTSVDPKNELKSSLPHSSGDEANTESGRTSRNESHNTQYAVDSSDDETWELSNSIRHNSSKRASSNYVQKVLGKEFGTKTKFYEPFVADNVVVLEDVVRSQSARHKRMKSSSVVRLGTIKEKSARPQSIGMKSIGRRTASTSSLVIPRIVVTPLENRPEEEQDSSRESGTSSATLSKQPTDENSSSNSVSRTQSLPPSRRGIRSPPPIVMPAIATATSRDGSRPATSAARPSYSTLKLPNIDS